MARHSEARFVTGKQLAIMLETLLRSTTGGNALEKEIRTAYGKAVGYISAGDQTELSRREIYATAAVARTLADLDKGKYAAALASFGDALVLYAVDCRYPTALETAQNALDAAKLARKA